MKIELIEIKEFMRCIFLCVFLCVFIVPVWAEDKEKDLCEEWRYQMDTTNNLVFAIDRSKEIYKKVGIECKAKIDVLIGEVFMLNGERDSAFFYNERALQSAKDIGSTDALILGLNKKAALYIEEENFRKAKETLAEARKLLANDISSERWVGYFDGMADIADTGGDYPLAISYIDSMIRYGNVDDSITLANSYHNMGVYQLRLSDYESSAQSFIKAYKINSTIEGGDIAANCFLLGYCYNSWKRYEPARKYLEQGINITLKNRNNDLLIKLYSVLATNLRLSEKPEEALATIDKVLLILKGRDDNFEESKAKIEKSRILLELEGKEDLALIFALDAYEQANKSVPLAQIGPALDLAEFKVKAGEFTMAKRYLDDCKIILGKLNRINYEADYNRILSSYYEKTNQYKKAFIAKGIYQKYTDSIANKEVLLQVASLERKFNTQQIEIDVMRLNQENSEQSVKINKAKASRNFYLLMSLLLLGLIVGGIYVYQKLRAQKKELDKTLVRAEELASVKNRLFSVISHDIRSMIFPFSRGGKVLGYHIEKGNTDRAINLAREMEQNAINLSNVVDNLLKWSMDQMEGYDIKQETISIHNELQEIFGVYSQHAKEKNIDFETEGDERASFKFDKGAFHVIFRNLIGNAIKFTENGQVEVNWTVSNKALNVEVVDNGTGMEDSVSRNLFEFSETNSRKGTIGEKGSGLGLQLVKQFVEKLNGKIEVSSQLGKGSQFKLVFPQ